MTGHGELLDLCVARLGGEYRCVVRPIGSALWVKWIGAGWMPVTERQVLRALRGVGDPKALAAALIELHHDSRVAMLPGDPMPELAEEPHELTFFVL